MRTREKIHTRSLAHHLFMVKAQMAGVVRRGLLHRLKKTGRFPAALKICFISFYPEFPQTRRSIIVLGPSIVEIPFLVTY